jgi:SAM-dependent methyltransferase
MSSSNDALRNRSFWNGFSDEYQALHGAFIGRPEPRWGMWQIPESELGLLGDVADKDVLELGCGAAQWSILLARAGARVVGLDNSERQLEHARRLQTDAGVDFPLVHASAEAVPLQDASFDLVFCDHGALTFADPYRVVPEVGRLLRPGGVFAFSHQTPLAWVCFDDSAGTVVDRLCVDYFGMRRHEDPDGEVVFQLPIGEWIRLFRRCGLRVEDLVELQPPDGATSTYVDEQGTSWARRWPMEEIWKVRKP